MRWLANPTVTKTMTIYVCNLSLMVMVPLYFTQGHKNQEATMGEHVKKMDEKVTCP